MTPSRTPAFVRREAASTGGLRAFAMAIVVLVMAGLVGTWAGRGQPVVAASVPTWTARLGAGGAYGSVVMTRTISRNAYVYRVAVSIRHFHPNATYTVTDRRGSCSAPGPQVTTPLLSIRTGATGAATRTVTITTTKGLAIVGALAKGSVAVRVGPKCGYLTTVVPLPPTPTPTPITNFSAGAGVPVEVHGVAEMIAIGAEPWSDAAVPTASGTTLDTIEVFCLGDLSVCGPDDFALRDAASASHLPLTSGRTPGLPTALPGGQGQSVRGWLTFAVPTDRAADVTLVWTVAGVEHPVPLHLPVPPALAMTLSLVGATGLEGAHVSGAVGTPNGYVAAGWTGLGSAADPQIATAWTSPDGAAWTSHVLPAAKSGGAVSALARGSSGLLVAAGYVNAAGGSRAAIWTSSDSGDVWRRVTPLPTDAYALAGWDGVTTFGSRFVVVGSVPPSGSGGAHAAAMVSADGMHWTRSTFVGGATDTFMGGVTAGGPGLIAWGGTSSNGDPESLDAKVWTSPDGLTWSQAPPVATWRDPDRGGATSRAMDLVFGSSGSWTAIATYTYPDGRPLVYTSADGKAWAEANVGASLRQFGPVASTPFGGAWLLGGVALVESAPASIIQYVATAWLGSGDTWAPVKVPAPIGGTTESDVVAVTAFATGPAGTIALGSWTNDTHGSHVQRGIVWKVPPR